MENNSYLVDKLQDKMTVKYKNNQRLNYILL